jgi:diguanylate cyclase (GGDEF)-like protein
VQNGSPHFYFEYPCHSEDKKRWFMMSAKSLETRGKKFIVISHINITERKIAEETALNLSQIDCLTGLINRRYFDELFAEEWKRSSRLVLPITVAMIDVDHFKLLNDHYGHHYGDECLATLGALVTKFAKRPGDIFARYGGDEIVMVFGSSTREDIAPKLLDFMDKIRKLEIPNKHSPVWSYVTVSIGVATWYPSRYLQKEQLLKEADLLLYKAKQNGRNRIEYLMEDDDQSTGASSSL